MTDHPPGMIVPLELVRQKRVALTDAALVQVLGEDYCLLTGLITAAPSTSLSKSSMAVATARHGHGQMNSHVSSAAPTSAAKPLPHHFTTTTTINNNNNNNNNNNTTTTTTNNNNSASTSSAMMTTSNTATATAIATDTHKTDQGSVDDRWWMYRAGVWAILGVFVAVFADRLAMAWYDSNNQ